MQRFRGANNQNTLIGIFLLILLAVIAGPSTLPRFLPFVEDGVPCDRLPEGNERDQHQSLIGRNAEDPFSLLVKATPLTAENKFTVSIIIINNSTGTVPILYNPGQILVGDNGSSGMGIIFDPPTGLTTGATRQNQAVASFPDSDIHLLGPRQRCVHQLDEFTADAAFITTAPTVKAYYRINSAGQVLQNNTLATPIYPDQGLRVQNGYIESDPVPISISGG